MVCRRVQLFLSTCSALSVNTFSSFCWRVQLSYIPWWTISLFVQPQGLRGLQTACKQQEVMYGVSLVASGHQLQLQVARPTYRHPTKDSIMHPLLLKMTLRRLSVQQCPNKITRRKWWRLLKAVIARNKALEGWSCSVCCRIWCAGRRTHEVHRGVFYLDVPHIYSLKQHFAVGQHC